jgi:transposase
VAWEQIEPLLPENRRKGGRWRDHRTVIDGILWKLRTGAPWRDLPERYGPWQTCFDRFNRWRRDGTWYRLLEYAQSKSDAVGQIERERVLYTRHRRPYPHRGCRKVTQAGQGTVSSSLEQ